MPGTLMKKRYSRVLPLKPNLDKATSLRIAILAACLSTSLLPAGSPPKPQTSTSWNPKSAAAYLDRRETWWMAWPPARLDHATFCVSCHTAVPYALARPSLRTVLGEKAPSENERRLLESVTKRVRLWKDVTPFYTESSGTNKTLQSLGTESVLNALILTSADAGKGKLSDDTRTALNHLWALQEKIGDQAGAWPWLNFGNEPFEANESLYYGASLAAVTVGMAPENYRANPEIQNNLALLGDYIRREFAGQPLIHQVVSLWASRKWPGLLAQAQQKSIIDDVLGKQQSDGGWSLSSLSWTWRRSSLRSIANLWVRSNDIPLARKSDGYATGLIVFVLGQMAVPYEDVHLQRGRSWLISNQDRTEGLWPGYSLVNRRDPSSGTGRFMSDAATAYAVLALTANHP
jgi:squalene-hopene/tetraprenyl-beta-curcumene cyclase